MTEKLILVIDDDPTGIQTAHGHWMYYRWSAEVFKAIFQQDRLAFLETNARSLPESEAVRINAELMGLAIEASRLTGRDFRVISRSDSSLRGHFPAEPDALRATLERVGGQRIDGLLLCFFLAEAGRVTIDNVHFIRQSDGSLLPVSSTEFAHDEVFGYRSADLTHYIEEKTASRSGGQLRAETIRSIPHQWLELNNTKLVVNELLTLQNYAPLVINCTEYGQLRVLVEALRRAEEKGKRFLFRTAASFVKAYGQIPDKALLTGNELSPYLSDGPVLTIIGSHTANTTRQLEALKAEPDAGLVELPISGLLTDTPRTVNQVVDQCVDIVSRGKHPVVYTARQVVSRKATSEEALNFSQQISEAVASVVFKFPLRPCAVIAKGGITSSDVATKGLLMQKAQILGQIRPSISVVLTGPESRFPQLPYVIFPGNTGEVNDLRSIWKLLKAPGKRAK
ncbi:MAG: hypothetical protein LH606_18750 [Cytophagaceae bacterium]|nr:hypothetical protein [Cytophagaceae bacterium]